MHEDAEAIEGLREQVSELATSGFWRSGVWWACSRSLGPRRRFGELFFARQGDGSQW